MQTVSYMPVSVASSPPISDRTDYVTPEAENVVMTGEMEKIDNGFTLPSNSNIDHTIEPIYLTEHTKAPVVLPSHDTATQSLDRTSTSEVTHIFVSNNIPKSSTTSTLEVPEKIPFEEDAHIFVSANVPKSSTMSTLVVSDKIPIEEDAHIFVSSNIPKSFTTSTSVAPDEIFIKGLPDEQVPRRETDVVSVDSSNGTPIIITTTTTTTTMSRNIHKSTDKSDYIPVTSYVFHNDSQDPQKHDVISTTKLYDTTTTTTKPPRTNPVIYDVTRHPIIYDITKRHYDDDDDDDFFDVLEASGHAELPQIDRIKSRPGHRVTVSTVRPVDPDGYIYFEEHDVFDGGVDERPVPEGAHPKEFTMTVHDVVTPERLSTPLTVLTTHHHKPKLETITLPVQQPITMSIDMYTDYQPIPRPTPDKRRTKKPPRTSKRPLHHKPEPTAGRRNALPIVNKKLEQLSVVVGTILDYRLAGDMFLDEEDGGTEHLQLMFLSLDSDEGKLRGGGVGGPYTEDSDELDSLNLLTLPRTSWVKLNRTTQTLYGMPMDEHVGRHEFLIGFGDLFVKYMRENEIDKLARNYFFAKITFTNMFEL